MGMLLGDLSNKGEALTQHHINSSLFRDKLLVNIYCFISSLSLGEKL